jgi:hypothetical protein
MYLLFIKIIGIKVFLKYSLDLPDGNQRKLVLVY